MDKIEVTNEDREAAGDLYMATQLYDPCCPPKRLARKMLDGKLDYSASVQAFARHRIKALSSPPTDFTAAWLIERSDLVGADIHYAVLDTSGAGWTADSNAATKFETEADAISKCNGGHIDGPLRVVEHGWHCLTPPTLCSYTLEEAAKVADAHAAQSWDIAKAEGQNAACASGRCYGARASAAAIRNMKEKP